MPLLQKFSGVLMGFCQHFRKKGMHHLGEKKTHSMVMNLCSSNMKMLLIGTFDLTGLMQVTPVGTEWIFARLCPISRLKALPSRQKHPRNTGKRFGRSPIVHPLCIPSSGCGNGNSRPSTSLEGVTPRGTHGDVRPGLRWILVILTLALLRHTSVLRERGEAQIISCAGLIPSPCKEIHVSE